MSRLNALRYTGAFAGLALLAACSGGSETPAAEEDAAAPAADAPPQRRPLQLPKRPLPTTPTRSTARSLPT